MDDDELPALARLRRGIVHADDRPAYVAAIDALRDMLDTLASARPDEAQAAALGEDLRALTARLAPLAVDEAAQSFARIDGVAGRGQTMSAPVTITHLDGDMLRGTVTFGRYFLGGNGAAHGGAVSLLFDEVLGQPANFNDDVMARTARLEVNYRSITPIDTVLNVTARLVSVDGRKRIVRGELRYGDRLCAEAEALFITLLPGQP